MTEPLPVVLLVSAQHPRACGVVDSALPATACATRTQPTRGLTCVQQLPQLRLNLTTRSCVGGPTAHKFAGTSNTGRSRAPLLSSQAQCRCPCRFPKGYVTASRRLARKDVRCVVPLDAVDCPQFDLYRAVPPPPPCLLPGRLTTSQSSSQTKPKSLRQSMAASPPVASPTGACCLQDDMIGASGLSLSVRIAPGRARAAPLSPLPNSPAIESA